MVSDRYFGPLNTMIPLTLLSSILIFIWIAIDSKPALIAFAVLYGLCASGMLSLFPAAATSLTPDLNKTGVRLGMIMSCISFACLTGPPIGGWLVQAKGGSYLAAQLFFGCVVAGGMGFLIAARIAKTNGRLIVRT
jgi:MFS family permease